MQVVLRFGVVSRSDKRGEGERKSDRKDDVIAASSTLFSNQGL